MDINKDNSNDLVHLQVNKEVVCLFKTFLKIVEDLQFSHDIFIKKIQEYYPNDIRDLDYLTPEKYEHLRKRILDSGNETSRSIIAFLEFYDFFINKDRLNQATSQRKIVKRFTSSYPIIIEEQD